MKYEYTVNSESVVTKQEMSEADRELYLSGRDGLKPYLRLQDRGMPQDPVRQIAWLLLQGGSCGFCKVCRDKPCDIRDGEKCTENIANYIRDIVHKESEEGK